MTAWTILHDLLAVVMVGGALVLFAAMTLVDEAARKARRKRDNDASPFGDVIEIPSEARSSHARSNTRERQPDNGC